MHITVPADILNIEYLRECSEKNGTPPHWFGLGFIQLKLTENTRIHFWLPWLQTEREEVHNHRYNFTSKVLAGHLHKEIYSVSPEVRSSSFRADHELFTTTCAPGQEGEVTETIPVNCVLTSAFDLPKDSVYFFGHDQFHTTNDTHFAITYLERESKVKSNAMVVKKRGAPTTCPFANPMPVDQVWEEIRSGLSAASYSSMRAKF